MLNRPFLLLLAVVVALPSGLGWTWCGCASEGTSGRRAQEHVIRSCCQTVSAKSADACCGGHDTPGPSLRDPSSCGCIRVEVPRGTSDDRTTRATVDTPPTASFPAPVDHFQIPRIMAVVALSPRTAEHGPPPLQRALPLVI